MLSLTKKKLPFALALFFLIMSIVVTMSVVPQKQQTASKAAGSASLSLEPISSNTAPLQKNTGDTISLDLMLDPGSHLVTFIDFQVQFDPTKLTPADNAFVENTAAFPVKVDGPILTSNSIKATLSIGNDATKAVKEKVKVGTLNFKALGPSGGTTQVVFGTSQILSSSPTDGAGQNVLSTTTPAYIQIGGSPISITTPSGVLPSGILLSGTPSSLTPGVEANVTGGTILSFNILLHGIGASGDNPNKGESNLNNQTPLHPQRILNIEIFDNNNQSVFKGLTPISYQDGVFVGQIGISNSFPTGNYTLKLKTDGHLRKSIQGVQKITNQQPNEIPQTALVAGDINGDNYLNVIDYNALMDCGYGRINPLPIADPNSAANAKICQAHGPVESIDLDDNGIINNFDYNLFLRELSFQTGD